MKHREQVSLQVRSPADNSPHWSPAAFVSFHQRYCLDDARKLVRHLLPESRVLLFLIGEQGELLTQWHYTCPEVTICTQSVK